MPSCPRNVTVRNVFRASLPDPFLRFYCMLTILCNSYALGDMCPPDHTGRNVWRTSPFDSVGPLGPPPWPLGLQGRPRTPERGRPGTLWAANIAQECPPDLTSACLRLHLNLQLGIFSVGEGAMHMKCPDDIGREAGIGRTRHGKELNVFRACP